MSEFANQTDIREENPADGAVFDQSWESSGETADWNGEWELWEDGAEPAPPEEDGAEAPEAGAETERPAEEAGDAADREAPLPLREDPLSGGQESVSPPLQSGNTAFAGPTRESLLRFAREYPEVRAEEIPQEVWTAFREGKGELCDLFARRENRQLRQSLAALQQNERNRERSTGSRQSAGSSGKRDAFDEGWDSL